MIYESYFSTAPSRKVAVAAATALQAQGWQVDMSRRGLRRVNLKASRVLASASAAAADLPIDAGVVSVLASYGLTVHAQGTAS